MVVVFAEPGKLLRLAGGLGPLQGMGLHGVMEWRLAPIEGGTRVTLFYRAGGYTPDDLSKFAPVVRSEEHPSELQSLMRISYAVFCLHKKKQQKRINHATP